MLARAHAILEELAAANPHHAAALRRVKFSWNMRRTKTVGLCRKWRDDLRIDVEFSWKVFAHDENMELFHDTVRHELAHAVNDIGAGHGPKWRRTAREFGANDSRFCTVPKSVHNHPRHRRWVVTCEGCGFTTHITTRRRNAMRSGKKNYTHNNCGGVIVLTGKEHLP
jgi:predicted SprT family Zn-dependent metalloprotease